MRLIPTVIVLAVLGGCAEPELVGDASQASPLDVPPSDEAPGARSPRLELLVEPPAFRDLVNVTVRMVVPENFTFLSNGGGNPWNVSVMFGESFVTRLYEYGAGGTIGDGSSRNVTIPPGSYAWKFNWNGHDRVVEGGIEAQPHGGDRVAPGAYTLLVEHKDIHSLRHESSVTVLEMV